MVTDMTFLAYWIRNTLIVASVIGLLVIGIIITAKRVKSTKILGVSYIISAVSAGMSQTYTLIMRFVGIETAARLSTAVSVMSLVCNLACTLCLCIFLHKNYGKKLIYIPLMLLSVIGPFANVILGNLFNKSEISGLTAGYRMTLITIINGFITGTVSAIIVIVIFYSNRNKEKVIPHMWILKIITFIWSCINSGIRMISYCALIAESTDKSVSGFYASHWYSFSTTADMSTETIGALVALIIPVYVLIMVIRASRRENAEILNR